MAVVVHVLMCLLDITDYLLNLPCAIHAHVQIVRRLFRRFVKTQNPSRVYNASRAYKATAPNKHNYRPSLRIAINHTMHPGPAQTQRQSRNHTPITFPWPWDCSPADSSETT